MKFNQCIDCGKENPKFDCFCTKCYKEDHPLIIKKNKIKLSLCSLCGSVLYDNEWHRSKKDRSHLINAIKSRIKSSFKMKRGFDYNIDIFDYEFIFFGDASYADRIRATVGYSWFPEPDKYDFPVQDSEILEIGLKWRQCSFCNKIKTQGYVAKLQLRGEFDEKEIVSRIENLLESLRQNGTEGAYIIKKEESPEGKSFGIDIRLGSKKAAKHIGHELKRLYACRIIETSEAVSLDPHSHKAKSRMVISIRFPSLKSGTFVKENNTVLQILDISAGSITLFDFKKEKKIKKPIEWLWDSKKQLLAEREQLRKYQLLSMEKNDNAAYIMDLDNYKQFYVKKELIKVNDNRIFLAYYNTEQVYPSQYVPDNQ